MGVVNYYSVGGQLQGERAVGGARLDYLTDALGSVTGTVQQTGAGAATLQNTYQYKPYGQMLVKTGTAPDPAFLWVGEHGYRQTGRDYSDVYVRARHYGSLNGRWTTKDPIGYEGGWNVYGYVEGSPVDLADPTGFQSFPGVPGFPPPPPPPPIYQPVPPGFNIGPPPGVSIGPPVVTTGPVSPSVVPAVGEAAPSIIPAIGEALTPLIFPVVIASGLLLICASSTSASDDLPKCKDVCPSCISPSNPGVRSWRYSSQSEAIEYRFDNEDRVCEPRQGQDKTGPSVGKGSLPCSPAGTHANIYCRRRGQTGGNKGKNKIAGGWRHVGSVYCCETCADSANGPVISRVCGTR